MSSSSRTSAAWEQMFRPDKPVKSKVIICPHCKKDSGYSDADLIPLRGNYELKCRNALCLKVAIRHMSGAKSLEPPTIDITKKQEKKNPWGQRGKGKKKKEYIDVLENFE